MYLDPAAVGAAIRARRTAASLTQAELAERLNVSAQAVSLWERGETFPDVTLLPDLSLIFGCSVDSLLGNPASQCRRRVTVESMRQALSCLLQMRELLGPEHFMFRTMIDALDSRMNSSVEASFSSENAMDAYLCEALLECIRRGDWVDATDVRRHIRNEKARDYTLQQMQAQGLK